MKVYLAAPYSARDRVRNDVASRLIREGHVVTSSWLKDQHEITPDKEGASWGSDGRYILKHVEDDFKDVSDADLLVVFTGEWISLMWPDLSETALHSGGRHVETGYALALAKPVVVMGEAENVFQRGSCQFLHSIPKLLAFLNGLLYCVRCNSRLAASGSVECSTCIEEN